MKLPLAFFWKYLPVCRKKILFTEGNWKSAAVVRSSFSFFSLVLYTASKQFLRHSFFDNFGSAKNSSSQQFLSTALISRFRAKGIPPKASSNFFQVFQVLTLNPCSENKFPFHRELNPLYIYDGQPLFFISQLIKCGFFWEPIYTIPLLSSFFKKTWKSFVSSSLAAASKIVKE